MHPIPRTVDAAGGRTPYQWTLDTGTLPAGLELDAATGQIAGMPTSPGNASFRVQVTDDDGRIAQRALSICLATAEVCNGVDDDCDGEVDEDLEAPPQICSSLGVCAGRSIPVACQGTEGWHCDYRGVPGIELDANGDLNANELLCDGRDGNCNGVIDLDGFPTLGQACAGGSGIMDGVVICRPSFPPTTTMCSSP